MDADQSQPAVTPLEKAILMGAVSPTESHLDELARARKELLAERAAHAETRRKYLELLESPLVNELCTPAERKVLDAMAEVSDSLLEGLKGWPRIKGLFVAELARRGEKP